MKRIKQIIQELSKFPPDAGVRADSDAVVILPPEHTPGFDHGRVWIPLSSEGEEPETYMGSFEDSYSDADSDEDVVLRFLYANPDAARQIAIMAITALHFDRGQVVPDEEDHQVSGADYIENVAQAIEWSGAEDVIQQLKNRRDELNADTE